MKAHIPDVVIRYDEFASDPDRRNDIVSNEKLRRKGCVATRSLDDGIEQLIQTYRLLGVGQADGR